MKCKTCKHSETDEEGWIYCYKYPRGYERQPSGDRKLIPSIAGNAYATRCLGVGYEQRFLDKVKTYVKDLFSIA